MSQKFPLLNGLVINGGTGEPRVDYKVVPRVNIGLHARDGKGQPTKATKPSRQTAV